MVFSGVDCHHVRVVSPEPAHFANIESAKRFMEAVDCGPDALGVRLLRPRRMAESERYGTKQPGNQMEQAAAIHDCLGK
jgi:hypothetical protein